MGLKGICGRRFFAFKGDFLSQGLWFQTALPIIDMYDCANQPCIALWRVDAWKWADKVLHISTVRLVFVEESGIFWYHYRAR